MTKIEQLNKLQKIIDSDNSIVFFGGAGVSTESNIPDFRSTSGLYNQEWEYPPEKIISHDFFYQNTSEFYRFYHKKMMILNAKPNAAHYKLVELEKANKLKVIITQNIDGLHQKAGSKKVLELHGSIHRNYCTKCNDLYDASEINNLIKNSFDGIPRCTNIMCKSIIKPDVVLYQENLNDEIVNQSILALKQCNTLIIGGTSLSVYPAAGLLQYFSGNNLIIINLSPTQYDKNSDLLIEDRIGRVFSQIKVNQ